MTLRTSILSSRQYLFKLGIIILLVLTWLILYQYIMRDVHNINHQKILFDSEIISDYSSKWHKYVTEKFFKKREGWKTSELGAIMFKNKLRPMLTNDKNRTYVILVWKYWNWLKRRHINNFGKSQNTDPLLGCPVQNCEFVADNKYLDTADAVIVHIQHGVFPKSEKRNSSQRWVILSDESPINTFSMTRNKLKLSDLAYMFNWSMTYRTDSDIPVPYGRTVPLLQSVFPSPTPHDIATIIPYWTKKRRDVPITIMISNCAVSHRMKYLNVLKSHVGVDILGKCSNNNKNRCPGHFHADCDVLMEYMFYLVLENSLCRHYITEKAFFNAYSKGAIPIIRGAPISDCERLLPPHSYLHVDNFSSPAELAKEINNIMSSEDKLLSYHKWRNHFEVVNEHGFFGSKSLHWCRVCEALNYNNVAKKVYDTDELRLYFDPLLLCRNN